MASKNLKKVYDHQYLYGRYTRSAKKRPEEHSHYKDIKNFVVNYDLLDKRCLEIACGRGAFQDMVANYTGADISEAAGNSLHKPFTNASATRLPFQSNSFDAIWSIATLEHVPGPERALAEMRRVLRPEGLLLLSPAWFCRTWAAKGYTVRPYSDLNFGGKINKGSIPIRNSVAYRILGVFLKRSMRLVNWIRSGRPATTFRYKALEPDYEHNWTSDSDAVASMDPFEAIIWFISRGDRCLNYPSITAAFKVRTGALVFRIRK